MSTPGSLTTRPTTYVVSATFSGGPDDGGESADSSEVSATTPPADPLPPSDPSGLSATPSVGQIALSWTASTDNVGVTGYQVERCQGATCTNFAQIATPTTTSFTDTGLAASTTYRYRVRATDASGNLSGYSNVASATTPAVPDTQPPTAPSNLRAASAGSTQINLSWTASTDNVGVTGYRVERCQGATCTNFAQIATPATTSFTDTGLVASTTYRYRVRATDAAGNLSGYSNVASARPRRPRRITQPPTAPSNLGRDGGELDPDQPQLDGGDGQRGGDGVPARAVPGRGVRKLRARSRTPTTTSFSDTGLAASSSYSYRVRATDAAGNLSGYSNVASTTTPAGNPGLVAAYGFDEGAGPTVADGSGNGNPGAISNATWTTAGKFGGALVFTGNGMVTITDAPVLRLTTAMTLSAWVNPSLVASGWRDIIYKGNDLYFLEGTSDPNAVPAGGGQFGATPASGAVIYGPAVLPVNTWSYLSTTWDGATLRLYVNGTQVASQPQTGALATSTQPLQIGGDSIFTNQFFSGMIDEVRVYNVALTQPQIVADMNTAVSGGTADTQPPTAPSGLTATAAGAAQINLSWTASTDNVGVTGYQVERCQGAACTNFAQIATPTTTSFTDTGLAASTTYRYRVRATDAAGNLSAYSNVATATTAAAADTQPPTAPSNLTATAVEREPDQSELDGVDGQRRGDGVSGRALPGRGVHELRPDRHADDHELQRHGAGGEHQLQLPGAGDGRRRQPQRLLHRGHRHDGGRAGHAGADGAERADGDGREPERRST